MMSFIIKNDFTPSDDKRIIKSERESDTIAWVYPYAHENWQKDFDLKKAEGMLVKTSEKVVVIENEKMIDELANGLYKFERKKGAEGLKIVFLEGQSFNVKWGVPQEQGVLTKDNVKIGASGSLSISISAPKVFCLNVLKDSIQFSSKEIRMQVLFIIKEAMRELSGQYSIEEIQKISREELSMMIESSVVDLLTKMGLSSEGFSLTGLGIPLEHKFL
ncbi:MAG: SPFH domain-containing protein [Candidatus Heimdallarchaeota archaeon]|nr:SPFH domain-containing protein [Candidatus Heimdallarchaeota archaeon]MCK4254258.1 SPFH domain-containing protein [Candidatus Heimdallarchaeota archaeon]